VKIGKATFDCAIIRLEFESLSQAKSLAGQGDCDGVVTEALRDNPKLFEDIPDAILKTRLEDFGAWDEDELSSREENEKRALWILAGNAVDAGCKDAWL
jgi:hypothetical protein